MNKLKSEYSGLIKTFSIIDKEINFLVKKVFFASNITKIESIYIRVVYENLGITQYGIAKIMDITKNLAIKHITNLENKGIIYKKNIGPYKKSIYLTEKGLNAVKKFDKNLENLGNVIFENFTQKEKENCIQYSLQIEKNLYKHNQRRIDESNTNYKKNDKSSDFNLN